MSEPIMFERFMPAVQPSAVIPTSCPQCGINVSLPSSDEAHRRILELESQVKLLNSKAAAAVDKLADYEDEVRSLREQCSRLQQQSSQPHTPQLEVPETISPPSTSGLQSSPPRAPSRLASLSSFLPGRKNAPNSVILPSNSGLNQSMPALTSPPRHGDPATPTTTVDPSKLQALTNSPSPDLQLLETTLEKERTLRLRAESSLTQTQSELEELTATLFGQANEMVATERKARAKLEERVKMLETRDVEKRRRLDRLEQALKRIERVRGLVEGGVKIEIVEENNITNHDTQRKRVSN